MLSSHGAVTVRVPSPERFAIHKLIVSQLRARTSSKPEKDLRQAATLIEAVVERFPGAIEDALRAAPKSALSHIERAAAGLRAHLPRSAADAWQSLESVGSSKDILQDSARHPIGRGMERYSERSGNLETATSKGSIESMRQISPYPTKFMSVGYAPSCESSGGGSSVTRIDVLANQAA